MFALPVFTALVAFVSYASAESHQVTMTNKCTSGSPVFLYEADGTPQGPATIEGQLLGGIAWLDGFAGADCQSSGVNCGVVEFTLRNDDPFQNAADFSFQTQGNHLYKYNMAFNYFGACTKSATCTSATCPGAYTGSDTADGAPVQCLGDDVGINIVFCP